MSVVGFKTAKGSIYAVDDAKDGLPKCTTRLKVSFGKGRGTVDDSPSLCLFVSEAGADTLDTAMVQQKVIAMVYADGDKPYQPGQPLTQIKYDNAQNIPAGKQFFFGVLSPQGEWEGLVKASPEPKVGLRPMEQELKPDGSITNHVGNTITELFDKPSALLKAAMAAAQTLDHTASRKPPQPPPRP